MAFTMWGLPPDLFKTVLEDGFINWLDNCFHRRGIYNDQNLNFPTDIKLSAKQSVTFVFDNVHILRKSYYSWSNDLNLTLSNLLYAYQSSKVPSASLQWINQVNLRIVVLIWHNLYHSENALKSSRHSVDIDSKQPVGPSAASVLGVAQSLPFTSSTTNLSPRNEKEFRNALTNFFLNWEAPLAVKMPWLESYASIQNAIHPFEKSFRWLDKKNTTQIEWAVNYIKKIEWRSPSFPVFDSSLKLIDVVLVFDDWQTDNSSKELFLIKMRKAWSIKKFRDKNKLKKSFNFLLNKSMENKLNDLASRTGKSKNEIIESCVIEAHKQTPKPIAESKSIVNLDPTIVLGEP
jgi:hypothetical protein